MLVVRGIHGGEWDAELAFAQEMSASIEVDFDEGPCAIGFKWDGLTYWFLICDTGCEWDADDPRETMIKTLIVQRDEARQRYGYSREGVTHWTKEAERYQAEVSRLKSLLLAAAHYIEQGTDPDEEHPESKRIRAAISREGDK